MIKLNNKGFAVSTVLYSLILMLLLIVMMIMSTMASNRSNNNELISAVEKELEGIGKSKMPLNIGDEQELPFTGLYRIELSDGTNFYTWYSELEKGWKATYNGNDKITINGTEYSSAKSSLAIISLSGTPDEHSAQIEFMGEEVNANKLGLQNVEEITSGNYYITITITIPAPTGPTSTLYILDNDGNIVKPGYFDSEKVWNITTMEDLYNDDLVGSDTERGNRVLDISTNKALEVFTSQIPISGTKIKAESYFSFDNPKKWIFDHYAGTNQYYICNVAMDREETDVNNKGKHCRTTSGSETATIDGETTTVHIDPLVLTYVPSSDPATPGSFEFRNICSNTACSAEDDAEGIKPEYQKFTLYRKS